MTKRWQILITILCMTAIMPAHARIPICYGVKGGLSTTLYTINELYINEHTVSSIEPNSMVGCYAAAFMRMNRGKYFLQTGLTMQDSRYSITFPTNQWYSYARSTDVTTISSTLRSIEIPALCGYHFVEEKDIACLLLLGQNCGLCFLI